MQGRTKKRLFNAFRILICVGALWIVARGVTLYDHVELAARGSHVVGQVTLAEESLVVLLPGGDRRVIALSDVAVDEDGALRISYGMKTAWRDSNKLLLLLALLIHFPVVFPQALRFRWLLRAQNIDVSSWECLKLTFAGNFLNFATPLGSNAGDAFKAYFASLHTEHKTEAVTTVVLDRVIGLGTLLAVVALIMAIGPGGGRLAVLRPYMLGLLSVGVVCVAVYFSPLARRFRLPTSWQECVPAFSHLKRMDGAARKLAGHRAVLVGAVLITVLLQATALAAYFAVAVAMAMDAHAGNIFEFFAYFYTGTVVQALPGPPQGLGTVELAYRYFFASFGSASQIVCMALAIRVVVLICALPGLLVTLTGSYRPSGEAASSRVAGGSVAEA